MAAWGRATGGAALARNGSRRVRVSLRIVPPGTDARAPAHAQVRALAEGEWPALRTAVNRIFRPARGDLIKDSPLLFAAANRENLRVIVDTTTGDDSGTPRGAHVIAHAGFIRRDAVVMRRPVRIACIGAVFTAPERRGQGLATQVLRDALQRARPGADLVMASGDRDLYRRQGLEPVPPLARFRMTPATAPPAGLTIRDATEDDLDAMAVLHDAEDVHFVRSATHWRALWSAGLLVDVPAVFSVVLRGGKVVAYAVAQRAGTRDDGSERPRRILEIAGDRAAIAEAAPLLAEELVIPRYDASMIAACERKGWVRTTRQFLITAEALTTQIVVIPWYGLDYL
jgi:predicted N-acetyltransferase YhbS